MNRTCTLRKPVAVPQPWPWAVRGFRGYARRYVAKHFHALRLARATLPDLGDGPVLLVLNHPSWWDPLIATVLSGCWPERTHFAPMDAAALERYGIFRRLGMYGVAAGTLRGAATFLHVGNAILARPDALLWVTAQGRFADVRERPAGLLPGVGRLAATMTHGVVVPLALEYTFWNERLPEALVRFGPPVAVTEYPGRTPAAWTQHIATCLEETQDALATAARRRDPAAFTTVVGGQAGVAGVYGRWQRLAAWWRGRPFQAEHGTKRVAPQ